MVTVQVELKERFYNLRVSEEAANFLTALKQSRYDDADHEATYLSYCRRLMNAVRKRHKEIEEQQLKLWDL